MKKGYFTSLLFLVLTVDWFCGFAAAQKKLSVLVVAREDGAVRKNMVAHYRLIVAPLDKEGISINVCDQKELQQYLNTGKYNVLVYTAMWDMTGQSDPCEFRKDFPAIQKAINDFLAKGGGVLILGPTDQQPLPATWALTGPWGAKMLCEIIRDSAGEKDFRRNYVNWAYTTQVFGPAAPGVKGIWYPCSYGKWWWPLEVDDTWQIVLKGEKTTTAHFESWSTEVDKVRRTIPAKDGVPLAAVKNIGKGRAVIMGLPITYSFASPHSWPGADITMYAGIDGKPSDGRKMMFNLIKWAAQPSLQAGFGSAKTPTELFKPGFTMTALPSPKVSWSAEIPTPKKIYKGLIGARTTISTGKSTVAEYADEARRAKIDFIVFLEDHKSMTPEKNAELAKQCRAVSDDTFQAIPGYTIEDEFGNQWFFGGFAASYPGQWDLSEDGKVLVGHYGKPERLARIPETYQPKTSTLGITICNLTGGEHQYQALTGGWNFKKASMPPWDFRDFNGSAIFTYDENGNLIDNIWDAYFLIQNNGNRIEPYVITLMDNAEQVAIHAKGYLNYIFADNLTTAAKELGSWHGDILADQYISSGPQIREFQCSQWCFPWLVGDIFRPDLMRNKVRLHITAENGLKEIKINDGTRLIRRFLLNGQKEFKREFELYNNPQQSLIVSVIDAKDCKALTKDMVTRNPNFQEFMCGDRNNHIFNGYTPRPNGSILYFGPPTGNGVTPDKGGVYWLMNSSFAYSYDRWSPSSPWDGGVIPVGISMFLTPQINVLGEKELPLHNTPKRLLHSQDVMIGEGTIDGGYPEEYRDYINMVWYSIYPVQPTKYLQGRMQMTYWRLKADAYVATLFEETLKFKNDVKLNSDIPIRIGNIGLGAAKLYEIKDSSGKLYKGSIRDVNETITGSLDDSGYVAFTDKSVTEGFYSMSKGLKFALYQGGQLLLFLEPNDINIKAGTEFHIKLLNIGTPPSPTPDIAAVSKADRAFGITNGKPAYKVNLESGKILSQRYTLNIDGQRKGTSGIVDKADLPAFLSIIVSNLNQNWTVVHYDRHTKQWRPTAALEGTAYVQIDPAWGKQSFFIGHPVTCNNENLILQLTQVGENNWKLEAHNLTDNEITANLVFNQEFAPLKHKPISVKVKAGESEIFDL